MLYDLINDIQQNNDREENFKILIELFTPLIKKYSFKINDYTGYYDLISKLYILSIDIPLDKGRFREDDKYIISYINKSIKNEYLSYLNNLKYVRRYNISDYDLEQYSDCFDLETLVINNEFINMFLSQISNEEKELFISFFFEGVTVKELADIYDVSRQSIYKRLKIIKKKIINILEN